MVAIDLIDGTGAGESRANDQAVVVVYSPLLGCKGRGCVQTVLGRSTDGSRGCAMIFFFLPSRSHRVHIFVLWRPNSMSCSYIWLETTLLCITSREGREPLQ